MDLSELFCCFLLFLLLLLLLLLVLTRPDWRAVAGSLRRPKGRTGARWSAPLWPRRSPCPRRRAPAEAVVLGLEREPLPL